MLSNTSQARNDNASNPANDDPIRLGQTKEIGALRIHRYRNCTKVVDTANAGKRGKRCTELCVGNADGAWNDADSGASTVIDLLASRGTPLVDIAAALRACNTVELRELRGIDVEPTDSEIEIINPWLIARFGRSEFSVRDMADPNELTLTSRSNGKSSAAKAYAWAKGNRAALADMRLADVRRSLVANGVEFHSFCGMD